MKKKLKFTQIWKIASRENLAARELKITRARNLDRVKAVREYNKRGLSDLSGVCGLF